MSVHSEISRGVVLSRAWPIILANASVPLLGLADTAVLGNLGTVYDLGAIALGALIFNFVYWSFGFLRMGTTGFVAQATGAGDEAEVRAVLGRALLLAAMLGLALIALQKPVSNTAFALLAGGDRVEAIAAEYFNLRIWGAPATLATFALMGALIGLGQSRRLLIVQLFLNGLNIALDVWFAGALQMGARGIALGTLIAEWSTLLFACAVLLQSLHERHRGAGERSGRFLDAARILDAGKLRAMLSANNNIMIRTLSLVFAFAWFTNQSAGYGSVVLAANHILLQFVAFSAFFLDGYAFVAESLVGEAVGAGDRRRLEAAVYRTSELAAVTAVLLALGVWLAGPAIVALLADIPAVRETAGALLPLTAVYVLLSVAAFQLDGIFIGATRTAQMRNAALISLAAFLGAWWLLAEPFGVQGLWWAFILYVCARAATLGACYPGLRRDTDEASSAEPSHSSP